MTNREYLKMDSKMIPLFRLKIFENGFQDGSTFSTHDSDVFPNFPISQRTQTLPPETHQYKPWRSMKWTPK